jgi:hypothetical protein
MYLKNRPSFTGGYVATDFEPARTVQSPRSVAPSIASSGQENSPIVGNSFVNEAGKAILRTGQAGADILSKITGIKQAGEQGNFRGFINEAPKDTAGVAGLVAGNVLENLVSPGSSMGRGLATKALTRGIAEKGLEFTAKEGAKGFARVLPKFGGVANEFVTNTIQGGAQSGEIDRNVLSSAALSSLPMLGGKLPRGAFATIQTLKGAKEIYEGDTAMGGFDVATGLLSAKGVTKPKGLLLEQPMRSYFPVNVEKAINKVTKDVEEIIPLGIGRKIAAAQQAADLKGRVKANPIRTIVQNGVPIETNKDGGFSSTAAREAMQSRINTADELLEDVLAENPQKRNSLEALKTAALTRIENSPVFGLVDEQDAAKLEVSRLLDKEIAKYGDMVDDATLQRIKRGLNSIGYDQSRPVKNKEAIRMTSNLFKTTIEDNNKGVANVEAINQSIEELLEADRVLKEMEGRLPRGGGRLTKQLNQVIGSVVGAPFGPMGSIVSGNIAQKLGDLQNDPFLRSSLERQGVDLSKYLSPQEARVRSAAEELMSAKFRKPAVPRLPAGSGVTEGNTIIPQTRDTSGVVSQEEAVRNLRNQGYSGPLTQAELSAAQDFQKSQQRGVLRLPEGSGRTEGGSITPIVADSSGIMSQEQAIKNLRAQGYQGPLTMEELTGLQGSTFKRIHSMNNRY